jgi:hypothetical protein
MLSLAHPAQPPRSAAILLTLLLHLALFGLWQLARVAPPVARSDSTLRWLDLIVVRRATPAAAPRPAPTKAAPTRPASAAAPLAAPTPVPIHEPSATLSVPSELPDLSAAAPADTVLQRARRDIGKIDRDLQRESPAKFQAPVSTPQSRLRAGIEAAAAAVPPKWYEAARIIPLGDQSGNGPRLYKVISAAGTYCITVGTNHTIADTMGKGIKPLVITCPG